MPVLETLKQWLGLGSPKEAEKEPAQSAGEQPTPEIPTPEGPFEDDCEPIGSVARKIVASSTEPNEEDRGYDNFESESTSEQ